MVFEQHEIEDAILNHFENIFSGQRVPVYCQDNTPDQATLSLDEIEQMLGNNTSVLPSNHFEDKICARYTSKELEKTLEQLPANKASGYDSIPNELLKNASPLFKKYLLIFLNQIIDDGLVPQQLNTGKCMLIHKVYISTCIPFTYANIFSTGWRFPTTTLRAHQTSSTSSPP